MPTGKNKTGDGKRKAKSDPKNKTKKKKQSLETKRVEITTPRASKPTGKNVERNAEERVVAMREKLRKSMEDPKMRDQIVRAIRTMMNDGQ